MKALCPSENNSANEVGYCLLEDQEKAENEKKTFCSKAGDVPQSDLASISPSKGKPSFNERHLSINSLLIRQRLIQVIEICEGRFENLFLQTPELLKKVQAHSNYPKGKKNLIGGYLKLRDLRQLCSETLGSRRSSIEVRRNCILLNLLKIRCIILYGKVYLLPQGTLHNGPRANNNCAKEGKGPLWGENGPGREGSSLVRQENFSAREENGPPPEVDKLMYWKNRVPGSFRWSEPQQTNESVHSLPEPDLVKQLVNMSGCKSPGFFEIGVLECLLVEVCFYLMGQMDPIVDQAKKLISESPVAKLATTYHLRSISDIKRRVDSLMDKLKGVRGAIHEILNNDEDLRRMELSRFWNNPDQWDQPPDAPVSEDIEMLLECYEQEIESMLQQVARVDEGLDDTLKMIQVHLASTRNFFLKTEIGLDLVSTVFTFASLIASFFGMNIPNGFEKNVGVFWPMVLISLSICGVISITTVYVCKRVKL